MKMDKKMIAALIAASLSLTAAQADDQNKSQNEPAGAEASSQSQSDAGVSLSAADAASQDQSTSAGAQAEIQQEPAGAEAQSSQDPDPSLKADSSIDEAAGAEADDVEDAKSPEKFVKKASQSGMMEVKAGELAAQKAQSSTVKQYGDRLAKDHQKANDQLKTIAQKKGITVSDQLEQKHQKHLDHLSGLSGEEFDREFIKQAAMHHKKDIKHFEKQAQEGEDPAIRSFASETLPILREHLKMAERLQENRNASIPELSEPAGAESSGQEQQDSTQQQDSSQQPQDSSSDAAQDPAAAQPGTPQSDSSSTP